MTSPMTFLRKFLFMPDGDLTQQDKDVAAVEQELKSGKDKIHAACASLEKARQLRATYNEVLERTKWPH